MPPTDAHPRQLTPKAMRARLERVRPLFDALGPDPILAIGRGLALAGMLPHEWTRKQAVAKLAEVLGCET